MMLKSIIYFNISIITSNEIVPFLLSTLYRDDLYVAEFLSQVYLYILDYRIFQRI